MANWDDLKEAIANVIKNNGNQEITGQVLQNVLNTIVSTLGENATFVGVATPTTNPGTPDGNAFYISSIAGIYSNFNQIEIEANEIAILKNGNNGWSKEQIIKLDNSLSNITIADSNYKVLEEGTRFQIVSFRNGYALNNNGEETAVSNVSITDFIGDPSSSSRTLYVQIKMNLNYDGFTPSYLNAAFYNSDKQFVSGLRFRQEYIILAVPSKHYVRISLYTESIIEDIKVSDIITLKDEVKKLTEIYCFGDSITQSVSASDINNTYPALLEKMLDSEYIVYNCGVSGATMANILGRMGGIPIFLKRDFVFSNSVSSISTQDNSDFGSAYPNVNEARTPNIINSAGYPFISPSLIDGYMCDIEIKKESTTTMTIKLKDKDKDEVILHKGSVIMTYGGKCCQDSIVIIMAGTNGSYDNEEDYVRQLEIATRTISGGKYLILSQFNVHYNDDNTYSTYKDAQLSSLSRLQNLENRCLETFGNKFVNMREQLVNNGLKYAIEGGFLTSSALVEENNIDAITNKIVPYGANKTSTSVSDYHNGLLYNVHPNDAGNYAISKIVYKALKQLYI